MIIQPRIRNNHLEEILDGVKMNLMSQNCMSEMSRDASNYVGNTCIGLDKSIKMQAYTNCQRSVLFQPRSKGNVTAVISRYSVFDNFLGGETVI